MTGEFPAQSASNAMLFPFDDVIVNQETPMQAMVCVGNSPVTGEFPAQSASNAMLFPFDDVIVNQETPMQAMKVPIAQGPSITSIADAPTSIRVLTLWRHQMETFPALHLCEEFTGHQWIPRAKASDAEL